jgi:protocatechuate 3,4-dioxygenase beta subunit
VITGVWQATTAPPWRAQWWISGKPTVTGSTICKKPNGPNLRARLRTDASGQFWFRGVRPVSYGIPTDGPVGAMLRATKRHNMRAAHLHFMISAPGHKRLVTQLFVTGDQYLDSDAVFGVKESLVVDCELVKTREEAAKYQVEAPRRMA